MSSGARYPAATIAKLLLLGEEELAQLAAKGQVPRATDGAFELAPAVQGYIRHLRSASAGSKAADGGEVDLEDFSRRFLSGDIPDLAISEKVKAAAAAMKATIAAQQLGGALVELETAEAVLFDTARAARDAWLNWPAKIGPLLAADLGLEADRVVEALTPHVQQQLEELGEPVPDFTPRGQG